MTGLIDFECLPIKTLKCSVKTKTMSVKFQNVQIIMPIYIKFLKKKCL